MVESKRAAYLPRSGYDQARDNIYGRCRGIKTHILILFCVTAGLAFSGCAAKREKPESYISGLDTTPEQQEIIELVGSTADFLFFEYETGEAFKSVKFWIEEYKDGELVSEPAGFETAIDKELPAKGTVALMFEDEPCYTWTFSVSDPEGGTSSYKSGPIEPYADVRSRGGTTISSPTAIEDGKEIVLHAKQFSKSDTMRAYITELYIEDPEYLKTSDYLHLIKCKFTK